MEHADGRSRIRSEPISVKRRFNELGNILAACEFALRTGISQEWFLSRIYGGKRVCALVWRKTLTYLAERVKLMATDLLAKADKPEELPSERLRRETRQSKLAA
jgi:hypothetical protein